jgi:hypothetical protein
MTPPTPDSLARALVESFKPHVRRDSLANVNWLLVTMLCEDALREARARGYERRAKEDKADEQAVAAEQSWKDKQGDDYGSY